MSTSMNWFFWGHMYLLSDEILIIARDENSDLSGRLFHFKLPPEFNTSFNVPKIISAPTVIISLLRIPFIEQRCNNA